MVAQQLDAGIDIVNDGEYGKSSWANYVLDRMTGFEARPDRVYEAVWLGRDRVRFREFMVAQFPRGATERARPRLRRTDRLQGHESIRRNIADLKAALAAAGVEEGFLTAVAPASTGYDASNEYYADERDYVFAIAEALREEYLEIVNAGLVLQVDDAVLANMYDELVQHGPARYRQWAELRVEALNHALRGIPEDRVRYHVCFGSWHVPHVADAPLEAIVDADAESARRRLLDRSRQRPARARMARVADDEAAAGQDPDSGRRHPSHDDRRASAPGGRSDRAVREARRPGERDCRHRLRLRAARNHSTCAPAGDVGEVERAVGRRASRVPGTVGS